MDKIETTESDQVWREVSLRRDAMLPARPEISAVRLGALNCTLAQESVPPRGQVEWSAGMVGWTRRLGLAAACLVIALLLFSTALWTHRASFVALRKEPPLRSLVLPRDESRESKFDLGVNAAELAALRTSLLTDNHAIAALAPGESALRLDLAIRPILIGGNVASLP